MSEDPTMLSTFPAYRFDPQDWYWRADDGRIYASARGVIVTDQDAAYQAFVQDGGTATVWPRDDSGTQTDVALYAALTPYGLAVPGYTPVPAGVSSAQAKIQCLRTPGAEAGKTLLDDVTAAVQAAGGEAAIWFSEAGTWQRANPYVASLSAGLKLTSAQVDQLFIAAAKISA